MIIFNLNPGSRWHTEMPNLHHRQSEIQLSLFPWPAESQECFYQMKAVHSLCSRRRSRSLEFSYQHTVGMPWSLEMSPAGPVLALVRGRGHSAACLVGTSWSENRHKSTTVPGRSWVCFSCRCKNPTARCLLAPRPPRRDSKVLCRRSWVKYLAGYCSYYVKSSLKA